jgi:hypothetical protein
MLSALQTTIVEIVSSVADVDGFALAGGGAMILLGLVDRKTRDLDFFARESAAVNRVIPAVEAALQSAGLHVGRQIDQPGFVRLEVSREAEACEVDLGYDARLWPVRRHEIGAVISTEELAADKTLALLGRAAARDFVDVQALAAKFGEERLCQLAAQKDLGFRREELANALTKIGRLDRDLFELDDAGYDAVKRWAAWWERTLLQQVRALGDLDRGGEPERGNELGYDPPAL